jgi:dolichol kinase
VLEKKQQQQQMMMMMMMMMMTTTTAASVAPSLVVVVVAAAVAAVVVPFGDCAIAACFALLRHPAHQQRKEAAEEEAEQPAGPMPSYGFSWNCSALQSIALHSASCNEEDRSAPLLLLIMLPLWCLDSMDIVLVLVLVLVEETRKEESVS